MQGRLPLKGPSGRVAFGLIEALTMLAQANPLQALEDSLVPGTMVEHQDKAWRLGRVQRQGEAVVGRLGYQAADLAELWDDELNDFTELSRATGLTSPFAISIAEYPFRVAFQIRGRQIRAVRFVAVLEALLNKASPTDQWRVRRESRPLTFQQWAEEVDRVILVRTSLKRPNPHYADRKRVKELVEGTRARIAEVILRAGDGDVAGIDVNDAFIREAIDHASRHYGTFAAVAERGNEQLQWSTTDQGAAELRKVPAELGTRDVAARTLRRVLGDPTVDDEELDEALATVEEARWAELEDDHDVLGELDEGD